MSSFPWAIARTQQTPQRRQKVEPLGTKFSLCEYTVFTYPRSCPRSLNIVSDVDDGPELVVQVYHKHRIGKDYEVGKIADTIHGILENLKDGGMTL